MRAYTGSLFRLEEHLKRLAGSSAGLGREFPGPPDSVADWVREALDESGMDESVLRLSFHWVSRDSGESVVLVREFHGLPRERYENGVHLSTAVSRRPLARSQDAQMKSSQFMGGVLAVLDEGKGERLLLGPLGTVAEGTVSNIFIVRGKSLLTPSVASGILKGVTRGVVMELAPKSGIGTQECFLTRHEIYNADECFMTNTTSEILPVVQLDGRRIGAGRPGLVTKTLQRAFHEETLRERRKK